MGIGLGALRWLVRSRRARWIAAGATALAVLLASAAAYALTGDEPPATGRAATVRADRGEVQLAVATTGTLRPAQTRSLGFGAAGTVSEVKVRPGDQVRSGQVLALIDDADAQDRVDSAQEALDQAEAARDAAQQSQDAQAQSPPSDCGGTGGGAAAGGSGGGGAVTVDDTGAGRAVTAGGSGGGGAVTAGATTPPASPTPSPSRTGRPSQAPSPSHSSPAGPGRGGQTCTSRAGQPGSGAAGGTDALLRAQQKVTSAGLTLAEAQEALAGTKVTAPIAGKVLTVAGAVGSAVSAGGTFITLGDVVGMEVSASFPEADAGRLATGLDATVTLADRPGQEFPAKVTQVDPVGIANGQMVTYGVLLNFDQVPADALVGQSASVRVTVQSVPDALRVPATAVHAATATAGTVLVATANGGQPQQVALGVRGDRYTEITAGLTEGDEVVASW